MAGSFSAVSKQNFARKYAFDSIRHAFDGIDWPRRSRLPHLSLFRSRLPSLGGVKKLEISVGSLEDVGALASNVRAGCSHGY